MTDRMTAGEPIAGASPVHEKVETAQQMAPSVDRIRCPYCLIGGGFITINRKKDGGEIPLGDPVMCDNCKRFFMLRVRMTIYGVPIENESAQQRLKQE